VASARDSVRHEGDLCLMLGHMRLSLDEFVDESVRSSMLSEQVIKLLAGNVRGAKGDLFAMECQ